MRRGQGPQNSSFAAEIIVPVQVASRATPIHSLFIVGQQLDTEPSRSINHAFGPQVLDRALGPVHLALELI